MYKSAPPENKDNYDFSRFFINTFSKQYNDQTRQFVEEQEKEVLDTNIAVFIRDRLIDQRVWEFSSIINSKTFDIKFENIKVILNWDFYDIKLNDVDFRLNVDIWDRREQIVWVLNSDYVFSNQDHYFKNIKIKIYDMNLYWRWEKVFDFWWNDIEIWKNIDILDFEVEMKNILSDIFEARNIYKDIVSNLNIRNVKLDYLKSWVLNFTFNYNWSQTTISVLDSSIISLRFNNKNILSTSKISFRELPTYLNNIKN